MENCLLGIDIGGSHISAGIANVEGVLIQESFFTFPIQADIAKADFAQSMRKMAAQVLQRVGKDISLAGIAIAAPGPFLYEKGIAALTPAYGKLFHLFGLHIPSIFFPVFKGSVPPITFHNDATCFGKGIMEMPEIKKVKKTLALTLGTGLGSVFILNGEIVTHGPGIPSDGHLYNQPFLQGNADDSFSSRGILKRFRQQHSSPVPHVLALSRLAREGNTDALKAFEDFGTELAMFLTPYLRNLSLQSLVLGGSISESAGLFVPSMQQWFNHQQLEVQMIPLASSTATILKGAAILAMEDRETKPQKRKPKRVSYHPATPEIKPQNQLSGYELFPSIEIAKGKIHHGIFSLVPLLKNSNRLVIDGFSGVDWEGLIFQFNAAFHTYGIYPLWISIESALKDEAALDEMLKDSMGERDSIFGNRFTGNLADFFDEGKMDLLQPDDQCFCILYGPGASLLQWNAPLLYAELPKNELQFNMRNGTITNLGCAKPSDPKKMYKRYYFAEWPVMNQHKAQIWPRIDYLLDVQYAHTIHWMTGAHWRTAMQLITRQSFRVKPWFEPGVWGGQWMKQNLPGLPLDAPNFAWSFELITPENGITFESDNLLLECSFDFLMFMHAQDILGDAYAVFKDEFPIRFDFLDTYQGGNLSIQCHPSGPYIKQHFGENFTQDETYYILDCEEGATVYLGFQDGINPGQFEQKLKNSFHLDQPIHIEEDVQCIPVHKHDLYLIPNQTIHGAGAGNLVLEISSTPYIFTFKLYDWLRPDMDGKPRPINIEHGIQNLDFSRCGKQVQETLIAKPVLLEQGNHWKRFALPTHPEHFYTIERYVFTDTITIPGNRQCHILMLVSGSEIKVQTANNHSAVYHYAETFIVPASAGTYKVTHDAPTEAMLIIAFVKPSFCR